MQDNIIVEIAVFHYTGLTYGAGFQGWRSEVKFPIANLFEQLTSRLAQLVERRTREHNVSGLYRCEFESPAGQLKLLIVFRMRR